MLNLILPTNNFVKRPQTSSPFFTRIVDTTFLDKIPVIKILDRSYESHDRLFCWYYKMQNSQSLKVSLLCVISTFSEPFPRQSFHFGNCDGDLESPCNLRATNSTPVA